MKRIYPKQCLIRSNVGDVKMMPFMAYITNTMRILGCKILYRKLKVNSISIITGNVEYIMILNDRKFWYQKCDFYLSTPL